MAIFNEGGPFQGMRNERIYIWIWIFSGNWNFNDIGKLGDVMNSAAELRRFEEQGQFEKAKHKVIDALTNDPMGLSISQLMTVCKLSIKTVKNVLANTEISEENGVYFISNPVPEITKPKRNLQIELLNILEKNPKGLLRNAITEILNITDKQFENAMWMLKKSNNVNRTGSTGSFHYQLIKAGTQKLEPQVKQAVVIEPVQTEESKKEESKVFCDQPVTNQDETGPNTSLDKYKSQIKTVVTRTSELKLDKADLTKLLSELFGLTNVEWFIENDRFIGAYMSDKEVS